MSPCVSGSSSNHVDRQNPERLGFWIINWASFMYSANVFFVSLLPFPLPPSVRKWGNRFVPDDAEHLVAAAVLELRPTHVLLLGREEDAGELLILAPVHVVELLFLRAFPHIEQPGEHEERDLFDNGQRVGDPARPELFPKLVDAAA